MYKETNLTVPVSPAPFVVGASGLFAFHDDVSRPSLFSNVFSEMLQEYNRREPISLPNFGCENRCEFQVTAPGWDIDCHNWTSPYRLMSVDELLEEESLPDSQNATSQYPARVQTMFWSNATLNYAASDLWRTLQSCEFGQRPDVRNRIAGALAGEPMTKMLSSMVKSTTGGNETLDWRYCLVHEAVQKYPVTATNTTITLQPQAPSRNFTEYRVYRADETSGMTNFPSTLGGFWLSVSHAFAGRAQLDFQGYGTNVLTNNSASFEYIHGVSDQALPLDDVTWQDPIDDMISMLQELTFRKAVTTTFKMPFSLGNLLDAQPEVLVPDLSGIYRTLSQTVSVSMTHSATVYQADFSWLGGALAVVAVAFCAVLSNLSGWWRLGRTVSMSPFEIAKAFDASILRQADSNAKASEIVRTMGEREVQYGASSRSQTNDAGTSANGWAKSLEVGSKDDEEKGLSRRELRFGRPGTVEQP